MPYAVNDVLSETEESNPKVARRNPRAQDPDVGCVYLASSVQEAQQVSSMVESERIRIYHAATLEDAESKLKRTRSRVLLTNTRFQDGDWKDALEMSVRIRPQAALVVASRLADEELWLGVLERGAYDLVEKPFQAGHLCRVLHNAHVHATMGGLRHMSA